MESGKEVQKKINVLEAMHYIMAAWQQVSKPFKIASVKPGTSTGRMVMKWQTMMVISAKTGKNCVEPRNTISKATSQWIAMWQQVALKLMKNYAKHLGLQRVWRKKMKMNEMVPSFAETYEALQKVKAFFYAQSGSDTDGENILSLEKSYFQLRQNSAKKQRTMYDFFVKKQFFNVVNSC